MSLYTPNTEIFANQKINTLGFPGYLASFVFNLQYLGFLSIMVYKKNGKK